MRKKQIQFIFILFLCHLMPASAQNARDSMRAPDFRVLQEDHLAVREHTQTVVSRVAKEMEEEGISLKDFAVEEDALAIYLQNEIEKNFLHQPEVLKKTRLIDWKKISASIRHKAQQLILEAKKVGRNYGSATLFIYLTIKTALNVLPLILLKLGQPAAAAAIFEEPIPISEPSLMLKIGIENLFLHHQVVLGYGGSEKYQAYENFARRARNALHLKKDSDVLMKLPVSVFGNNEYAVFGKDGFTDRLLEHLGWKDKRLSLKELKRMVKKQGMKQDQLEETLQLGSTSTVQFSLLFSWLMFHLYPEEVSLLQKNYPLSFTHVDQVVSVPALEEWADQSLGVKDCSDLRKLIASAPVGISVPLEMMTWKEVMLPNIVESFQGFYANKFRKMIRSFEALSIRGRIASNQKWDQAWTLELETISQKICSIAAIK